MCDLSVPSPCRRNSFDTFLPMAPIASVSFMFLLSQGSLATNPAMIEGCRICWRDRAVQARFSAIC